MLSATGKRRLTIALVGLVVFGAIGGWLWQSGVADGAAVAADATDAERAVAGGATDSSAYAPTGTRVKVRVLNASGTRGLARRATVYLRALGYDVVDYDSDRGPERDSSEVVIHMADTTVGSRMVRALRTGHTVVRRDSLRYVDLTVILGRDWQPPAESLRP